MRDDSKKWEWHDGLFRQIILYKTSVLFCFVYRSSFQSRNHCPHCQANWLLIQNLRQRKGFCTSSKHHSPLWRTLPRAQRCNFDLWLQFFSKEEKNEIIFKKHNGFKRLQTLLSIQLIIDTKYEIKRKGFCALQKHHFPLLHTPPWVQRCNFVLWL